MSAKLKFRENICADLKKWEKILLKIHAVLDDAENKKMKNRSVQILTLILDEFDPEALQRKLVDQSQASTSKVKKIITSCFTGLCPRSIKFNFMMASLLKEITTGLEAITKQIDILEMIENSGGKRPYRVESRRRPETSLSDPHIYGREKDKEAILELLLKDESTNGNFSVISIVGMGGIGKTTLAQLAYNDVQVDAFFDVKIWACVSDNFDYLDIIGITKTILQSTDFDNLDLLDFDNLDLLQVSLKEKLSGQKFLIVLDDVCNENYEVWTLLCRPFQAASSGSKILVTTRNQNVSSMVGTLQTYQLNKLSNDDCLSMSTQHSTGKTDFGEHHDLELISLLRGKASLKDWEDVLDSFGNV